MQGSTVLNKFCRLHPLPPEIYLLFWHYSPVLGHPYYSQNYASIFGQSLLVIEVTFGPCL